MSRTTWIKGLGLALLGLALLAPPTLAQTTGRIAGTVVDQDGATLPGVTVTLSSPALQGDKVAVTDSQGQFRFLGLPPANSYTVKTELEGFQTVEQTEIDVNLDSEANLRVTMSSAFEEQLVVVGEAPVVDRSSTTTGAAFSEELFSDLPVSRDYTGMAFAAPGVVTGGLGNNASIGGASAAENRYVINGLDTTDPAFGTIGAELAFEFIQEVEIKTGGYEAEYGGALGGILNVVTKSGSNELHGDVFGYYTDDSLQETSPPTATQGEELGFTEYDFGADLGGKMIQDKLWYFLAVNPAKTEDKYTSLGGAEFNETDETLTYAGKLTLQANPNHQLYLSVFGYQEEVDDIGVTTSIGKMANTSDDELLNAILGYNAAFTSSVFFEASAGRYDLSDSDPARNESPRYVDRTTGRIWATDINCPGLQNALDRGQLPFFNLNCDGSSFNQGSGDRSRDQFKATLSYFAQTGSIDHEFKFGGEIRQVDYTDDARYPGLTPGPIVDETGAVIPRGNVGWRGQRYDLFNGFYRVIDYRQASDGTTDENAIFIQDQMRIGDYFTLNLGVRADDMSVEGEATPANPNQSIDFGYSDTVAPRLGFTWDVTRNGRSKLYGHFGRFYESIPLDINVRAFGNEIFEFYYFYYPSDGSLPNGLNQGEFFYDYPLGTGVGVSSDLKAMYTEEIVAGFEYEIATNMAVGIKYVTRDINDVIEDISVDGGHTYFITNPGGTFTVNPVTGEVLEEAAVFPVPSREYEAIELSFNKRFSNNWQMGASYVNSENKGNYGGLFRQDNGQLDPNITSLYDLPSLLKGAEGLLPNDREHQFKVFGSYVWPFKLVTGFYGQFLSGTPISKLGGHTIYGANERFITPRGSAGRTPDTWNIDLHLEYPITFGNDSSLRLIADVFNITDESKAATVSQTWTNARLTETTDPNECGGPGTGPGTSCPNGNPQWGTATSYQTPRTIRLGLKFSF